MAIDEEKENINGDEKEDLLTYDKIDELENEVSDNVDDILEEIVEPDEVSDSELALDGILSELSGFDDAIINVYKTEPGKYTNMSHCFSEQPAGTTLGDIMNRARNEFGHGHYRIHIKVEGRLVRNKAFAIAKPLSSGIGNMSGQTPDKMFELMSENLKEKENSFFKMAEIFTGNQSNQPNMTDMVQQMVSMKELLGFETPKRESPLDMIKTMMEMRTLMEEFTGNSRKSNINDTFITLAKEALPHLADMAKSGTDVKQAIKSNKLIKNKLIKNKIALEKKRPISNPNLNPIPKVQPKIEKTGDEKVIDDIKNMLSFLIKQAGDDKSIEESANFVIDVLSDEQLDLLYELLEDGQYIIRMALVNPSVLKYKQWFSSLRDNILRQLNDMEVKESGLVEDHSLTNEENNGSTVIDESKSTD